uniref:Uncharacterized protein n=1 Tax=Chromera velia CCMP2878 TaxID=1169474 RepID=A0A0G4HRI1_9ALVE|mmetsp:Transcript_3264/g.6749  ORF Transcript_3264/g.6749 Transcript_3264/m.6749 type:complete len:199 (+) Transcript_3264:251-847(+)|eukprot:Cvel_1295.t1-p1 / transcript=Cvel_1295.t1 / gene=Cvel_1295 / organism=Chromera_velia_CCMP2878 / gene_product=hypothetical protein / transcript_product=hypothetical protein / location=Cvel_scaffold43:149340-152247(+) / protein_length=198 / sequence_SO=supercontig / SO=protein_coding / is_pseudo=false
MGEHRGSACIESTLDDPGLSFMRRLTKAKVAGDSFIDIARECVEERHENRPPLPTRLPQVWDYRPQPPPDMGESYKGDGETFQPRSVLDFIGISGEAQPDDKIDKKTLGEGMKLLLLDKEARGANLQGEYGGTRVTLRDEREIADTRKALADLMARSVREMSAPTQQPVQQPPPPVQPQLPPTQHVESRPTRRGGRRK